MKYTLLLLIVVSTKVGLANDTLTRAQVWNYSVGDTFIYRQTDTYPSFTQTHVGLTVISNVYFSANSDTLFINTGFLTNLNDYEIAYMECDPLNTDTAIIIQPSSQYNGRTVNGIECSGGVLEQPFISSLVAEGLGGVYATSSGGNSTDGWWSKVYELLYYSKGNERWGTMPVGIKPEDIKDEQPIYVFPTVNRGTFNISMNQFSFQPEFKVMDIYGRTIFTSKIQDQVSTIHVEQFVPGFYVWTLTGQNRILKTGKLILE